MRLDGEMISDGLIRIEEKVALNGSLGNTALNNLLQIRLLPGDTTKQPSLYIDTETTGLSGGSGTLAFLVGIAEIKDSFIKLRQFLITSFAAESALLTNLAALIGKDHRFVSYNGKSYDLPLLLTRFRMQGLTTSFEGQGHLDLLHPVRRLFGRRWEDCRLTTVERRLLQFTRKDDLPGSEAPAAWSDYLQGGDGERLIKVVDHNRQDILSLTAIHYLIGETIHNPDPGIVDLYKLSRWLLEFNEDEALQVLRRHRERLCDDGKRLLGYLYRRAECWESAVSIWEELAVNGCIDSIERLAKYHEHVSKDLHAAMRYCKQLPGSNHDHQRKMRLEQKLRNHFQHRLVDAHFNAGALSTRNEPDY